MNAKEIPVNFDPAKNAEFLSLIRKGCEGYSVDSLIKNLLSTGAVDINYKDEKTGESALHIIAEKHAYQMIDYLRPYNPEIDIKSGVNGDTPLEIAVGSGCVSAGGAHRFRVACQWS